MDLGLIGKVALVTGASRGIGAAIAKELASEGVNLCLIARESAKIKEVAAGLRTISHVEVETIAADLRDSTVPDMVVREAVTRFGRIDLLVNNAGATRRGGFFDLTNHDWEDGFALKFHGYVRMTRAAWPHLRQSTGSIINIVGIGARVGSAEFTIGGSVNAALLNFTKAMADIGIKDGVRVNAINPGLIETGRFGRNVERVMAEHGIGRQEALSFLLAAYGITRVGQPEEVGALTAYLASARAAYIHGSIIDIDGGSTRSL